MDHYSSGEELVIKTRKPYTITKQRERWTEEEHNRFLEALKLYGRAWQRIEEHIGTKTAVQIRSHAQKFFTKLEKEALLKGVPVRQALNIEIPPPRPKRKPSNPYPRKTSAGTHSTQLAAKDGNTVTSLSSLHSGKHVLNLEKEPIPEQFSGDENLGNADEDQDEENCTEALSYLQDAPASSSANTISMSKPAAAINLCTIREFVPILEEVNNQDQTTESHIEPKGNQKLDKHENKQTFQDNATSNTSSFGNSHPCHVNLAQGHNSDELFKPAGNFGSFSMKDIQAAQTYPRHVPVHIVDGSLGSAQNVSSEISYQEPERPLMEKVCGQTNLFAHQSAFTTTEHHSHTSRSVTNQIFPTFHPLLTPGRANQEDYRSLLTMSHTFSSFIVSALLQNPAAHAAASFAATFWPSANLEASSADSASGGLPLGQSNSASPSIAAIAAATVAAATAWWTAHGLLPSCPPFLPGFTCTPSAFTTTIDNSQPGDASIGKENTSTPEGVLRDKTLDPEKTEILVQQHSASKSPTLVSSDNCERSGERELNTGINAGDAAVVAELHDSSRAKIRKLVERSSCGSNTPSSSDDVETDALEINEKAKEELKEADASPSSDSSSCRSRSYISLNDSWKEVSEEGRLAFQALFSREVLPQSFSRLQNQTSKLHQKNNMEHGPQSLVQINESASHLDLNRKLWMTCSGQQPVENNAVTFLRPKQNGEGMVSLGLGHAKLKANRTGFKPYQRCSVDAKEMPTRSQNDEKCPKRMRLGGEAST